MSETRIKAEHLTRVRSYLPCKSRLRWFKSEFPNGMALTAANIGRLRAAGHDDALVWFVRLIVTMRSTRLLRPDSEILDALEHYNLHQESEWDAHARRIRKAQAAWLYDRTMSFDTYFNEHWQPSMVKYRAKDDVALAKLARVFVNRLEMEFTFGQSRLNTGYATISTTSEEDS